MPELSESFERLLGRQPTDKEVQDLLRVRDALGIKNNDALWLVLMALQHYQAQYERIPGIIDNVLKHLELKARTLADIQMRASAESVKEDLANAVAAASHDVARKVAGTQRLIWIAACAVIVSLTVVVGGWYVHKAAYEAGASYGYGLGYDEAKNQVARAAWANTPEGRSAYQLAQFADVKALAACSMPGWSKELQGEGRVLCAPRKADDGALYGWYVPRE
jgi:hypothetical protein